MKEREPLFIWVIYNKPKDYPTKFVMRKWAATDVATPTDIVHTADSLEEIRKLLPQGQGVRVERSPGDDSCIVESWV